MARTLFGTDGVRGRANIPPMTPEIVMRLGAAAGRYFRKDKSAAHRVVIGKDTRLSGYMFENALTAGVTSTGMNVLLLGPVPTPAVGQMVTSMRADVGVMISASHNAHQDNGIKFFGPDGFKLSDEAEAEIERIMQGEIALAEAGNIGRAKRIDDGLFRYVELETSFAPTSSDTIHYAVQYNQTDFEFTSRLASYYNQWFYYNGTQLVFGSPSNEETELINGVDLKEFTIELLATANNSTYFTKDYLNQEQYQKNTAEVAMSSEGYHGFISTKSQELYTKNTKILHNPYHHTDLKPRLDTQVEQYTKAKAIQQVILKGSSDNPEVNLGEVINVRGYGRYRITSVTHTNTETGVYMNHFEAVTADFDAYPKMDLHNVPKSEIQIAKVVENADTDNLGRIKVQFAWQRPLGETTPWLRMITPHAGADKGFHFIPEIGEEVAIGFESGNAERPFVMGSLYTGSAKPDSWQTDTNDIKAIRTRSGHTIELNDTRGGEMITISDKNSNIIQFDTATSSIMISAPENLILQSKNMEIRTTETLKIATGKHKIEQITQDYKLTASNIYEAASQDMKSQGENITRQSVSDMNVSSTGGNINKQADQKVNNNSGEQGNVF